MPETKLPPRPNSFPIPSVRTGLVKIFAERDVLDYMDAVEAIASASLKSQEDLREALQRAVRIIEQFLVTDPWAHAEFALESFRAALAANPSKEDR